MLLLGTRFHLLIVIFAAADAGSVYEPHPTLTYSYDPTAPGHISRNTSQKDGKPYTLGPHPADPTFNVACADSTELFEATPGMVHRQVRGQEIWVYCGHGG